MMQRVFRKALVSDLDELSELEELCFPEEPWSRQMFLDELNNPMAFFCVIEEDGRLAAYIVAWIIMPFECQIGSIAVHPDRRRQGLAGELLDALFDVCREVSVDEAALEVRVSNAPAIALYEKYGFKKVGVRRNYYQDGEDAYNMVCTGHLNERR